MTASGEAPKSKGDPPAQEPQHERPGSKAPSYRDAIPIAWGSVVTDSLKIRDPAGLARRLRSELELGPERRHNYGHLLEALDRSARNYDDAGRLHRASKLEEEHYQASVAERLEVMRTSALAELMAEYREKARPSPAQRDVDDRMVANWPDEYRNIRERLSELHGATRSLEVLRDAWFSRCADLRVMADKARPAG